MDVKLKADIGWIKNHERLIIVVLVLLFAGWLGNKYLDTSASAAHDNAIVQQEAAKAQTETNKQLAAQVALQAAAFENDRITRQQEQQALLLALDARGRALKASVSAASAPKTPPEAVNDLSTTYKLPEPVVPTDIGAVVPTKDLQLFTVTKLQGDACTQDLTDTRDLLKSSQAGEKQAESLVTSLQEQVKGKDAEIAQNKKASDAVINDMKAAARKSKRNWFIAGWLAGLGTRAVLKW